jgi:hypothetical protein
MPVSQSGNLVALDCLSGSEEARIQSRGIIEIAHDFLALVE